MNGCRWQEKSFSVATAEVKPLGICDNCGIGLSAVKYVHNGKQLCQACFAKQPTLRQRLGITDFGFNTTKDKLFEFDGISTFGKHIQITSKGQWKRELKKRGLTDDVDYKKPNELKQTYEEKKIDRKFIRNEILRELQEKGLRDKLIRRR